METSECSSKRENQEKEFLDETYDYKPVSITHWMPYPEAPKEESDNE